MKDTWSRCKNLLCIRVDNMGDLMMSSPAIRALKESLACKITLLTSPGGNELAKLLPFIDDTMVCNAPWVKLKDNDHQQDFLALVEKLKERKFDGCVVFTVFSQNPMPAILLAFLAEIPLRLAYCRENPYHLLSDWVPDQEPYSFIKHQVERDLYLVAQVGATTKQESYQVKLHETVQHSVREKLREKGISDEPYLVFHCGVSERKREYPPELWVQTARLVMSRLGLRIVFTGSESERIYIDSIQTKTGGNSVSVAGLFSLEEFIIMLQDATLVTSVNTSTVHLSSAVQTPVVVLYAQTNPQHIPWNVKHSVFEYSIPKLYKSKNEVIAYVDRKLYSKHKPYPSPEEVCETIKGMLLNSLKTA